VWLSPRYLSSAHSRPGKPREEGDRGVACRSGINPGLRHNQRGKTRMNLSLAQASAG